MWGWRWRWWEGEVEGRLRGEGGGINVDDLVQVPGGSCGHGGILDENQSTDFSTGFTKQHFSHSVSGTRCAINLWVLQQGGERSGSNSCLRCLSLLGVQHLFFFSEIELSLTHVPTVVFLFLVCCGVCRIDFFKASCVNNFAIVSDRSTTDLSTPETCSCHLWYWMVVEGWLQVLWMR